MLRKIGVEEQLVSALQNCDTKDYSLIIPKLPTEGGQNQVCKAMEERIDRERDKEKVETLFIVVKNLMEAMKMTAEQAMMTLKISDVDREVLRNHKE